MAEKDDQDWLDTLAGRASRSEDGAVRDHDRVAGARLEDLTAEPGALEGDPFARRSNWGSTLRACGRGWVAAAIAVSVLVLGWQFRTPLSQEVARTPPGAVTRLVAVNPPALKQQIVNELRAAGVEAMGYDRLGLSGVDARLPQPVPAAVRATLGSHGIAVPTDGVMRVEIAAPAGR